MKRLCLNETMMDENGTTLQQTRQMESYIPSAASQSPPPPLALPQPPPETVAPREPDNATQPIPAINDKAGHFERLMQLVYERQRKKQTQKQLKHLPLGKVITALCLISLVIMVRLGALSWYEQLLEEEQRLQDELGPADPLLADEEYIEILRRLKTLEYKIERRVFPENDPTMCIAASSCGWWGLMARSLYAIISHLENFEPAIRYEVVWVDQGCPVGHPQHMTPREVDRNNIEHDLIESIKLTFQIEKSLLAKSNAGSPFVVNQLLWGLCKAKNVLLIEEAWQWLPEHKENAIARALSALEDSPKIAMVLLRPISNHALDAVEISKWRMTHDNVAEYRYYRGLNRTGVSRMAFLIGGALVQPSRFEERAIGYLNESLSHEAKLDYAQRLIAANMLAVEVRLQEGCSPKEDFFCNRALTNIAKKHLGVHSGQSHDEWVFEEVNSRGKHFW